MEQLTRFRRASDGTLERKPRLRPPRPPKSLSPAAAVVWKRASKQLVDAGRWRPDCTELLMLYSELRALYEADPPSFGASRLIQLRLTARDVGLVPPITPSKGGKS